eukprot:CAMPEP_0115747338 /NCGR_PEP_ID=MMETSP0272-20121206/93100_1 /TAXON_ID=71861 /ORGANISM="Scrippsiella trochoidea, Strain CCMP3099" /LENGTH=50 /DNA_ID=CAMNT_0003192305 /DNA_START=270 /DNA_END=418 /DNA_ORIENTATION=-
MQLHKRHEARQAEGHPESGMYADLHEGGEGTPRHPCHTTTAARKVLLCCV